MAAVGKKVIFMTGAPEAAVLNWTSSHLTGRLDCRVRRYLDVDGAVSKDTGQAQTQTQASLPLAKWRQIPMPDGKNATKKPSRSHDEAQFLSFDAKAEIDHVKFLEHSLAVLQSLESSQIEPPEETIYEDTTYVTTVSFTSNFSSSASFQTTESISTSSSELPVQQTVNFTGAITDLKRIPTARHLDSIHPQTMTINVLASVISVRPARTVRLRKRAGEMDIIEVLVGDETRAGFTISFWLPTIDSQAPSSSKSTLRETLSDLRVGNILLITHIALSSFNGNVYGQSLSKRITRNNTSIVVLSNNVVGLPAPSMAKLERVKAWSENFVGGKTSKHAAESALDVALGRKRQMMLPPDTQPDGL